jgi:transcriptional regulator with XRE-family HTH domain
MTQRQAKALGQHLRDRRAALDLSTYQLGELAGIDQATVVRLEQGYFSNPSPAKLRTVAEALGLRLADVFAMADYVVPKDLPSFRPYLRTKYRGLPAPAVDELERSFQRIAKRHGLSPDGPTASEDEQPEPTKPEKGGDHANPARQATTRESN